jgi:hypothetical protein
MWSVYPLGLKVYAREQLSASLHVNLAKLEEAPQDITTPFDPFEKRKKLSYYYPMSISDTNVHFLLFRSVVDAASRRKLKTLIYFNPVNVDLLAESGILDRSRFEGTRKSFAENAKREYIYFLDLCELLPREDFADDCQHYTEIGKHKIAEALVTKAVGIFEKDGDDSPLSVAKKGRN